MSRVAKCIGIMVAAAVGAGWSYDAHRFGMAGALGVLTVLFFFALLPAAELDLDDRFRR